MPQTKDIAYYRRLPYRRVVEMIENRGGDTTFVARIHEIPFIRIHGANREEALLRLDEVFDDCISALLDAGAEIPEPELWPGKDYTESKQLSIVPEGDLPVHRMLEGVVLPDMPEMEHWTPAPAAPEMAGTGS